MLLLLLLLALAGVAAWADRRGHLERVGSRRIALILGIAAAAMLVKGQFGPGIAAAAIAGWLATRRRPAAPIAPPPLALAEARALLEVEPGASASEIRAAHRRLIARVHPDTGGSARLTAQVNAARDALLASLGDGSGR